MDLFRSGGFPIGSEEWHRGPIRALVAEAADLLDRWLAHALETGDVGWPMPERTTDASR